MKLKTVPNMAEKNVTMRPTSWPPLVWYGIFSVLIHVCGFAWSIYRAHPERPRPVRVRLMAPDLPQGPAVSQTPSQPAATSPAPRVSPPAAIMSAMAASPRVPHPMTTGATMPSSPPPQRIATPTKVSRSRTTAARKQQPAPTPSSQARRTARATRQRPTQNQQQPAPRQPVAPMAQPTDTPPSRQVIAPPIAPAPGPPVAQRSSPTTLQGHGSATRETVAALPPRHPALQQGEGASPPGSGRSTAAHTQPIAAVTAPQLRYAPKPVYPHSARRRGLEGEVTLMIEMVTDGSIGQVNVAKSSGYAPFDDAAQKAVKQWRHTPATHGGAPVTRWAKQTLYFTLPKQSARAQR